jgi:CubicO group peptidase (beta-lactamase class C family)
VADLARTFAELDRGTALGWHTSAQLFAPLGGEVVAGVAVGEARPGVPVTPAAVVEWASATKPVTCSAAALLWQRGRFELDDQVGRHLPAFAGNCKPGVTVRHLLTHTGGLTEPDWRGQSWEDYAAAVCRAPLQHGWTPGAYVEGVDQHQPLRGLVADAPDGRLPVPAPPARRVVGAPVGMGSRPVPEAGPHRAHRRRESHRSP